MGLHTHYVLFTLLYKATAQSYVTTSKFLTIVLGHYYVLATLHSCCKLSYFWLTVKQFSEVVHVQLSPLSVEKEKVMQKRVLLIFIDMWNLWFRALSQGWQEDRLGWWEVKPPLCTLPLSFVWRLYGTGVLIATESPRCSLTKRWNNKATHFSHLSRS